MSKYNEKMFFADRWFIFDKESNGILIYKAKINDKVNNTILEIDTCSYDVSLIFIKNKKTIGRLNISNLDENQYSYEYQQFEPENTEVNGNLYTNLLVDLQAVVNGTRLEETSIMFSRKKKLNKMCYLEPKFPLNTRIDSRVLDINSKTYTFFKNAYSYYTNYVKKISESIVCDCSEENEVLSSGISNLVVPEEIYIYDRNYHLSINDVDNLVYRDKTSNFVQVKLDLENSCVKYVEIHKNDKNRFLVQIFKDSKNDNKITSRFVNKKKCPSQVNGIHLDHTKIRAEVTFTPNFRVDTYSVEINAGYGHSHLLEQHPYFTNQFLDFEGNTYYIRCNTFAEFQNMVYYSPGIFNNIQSSIFVEKEESKVKELNKK